jgi:DNA-binding PucR family transcriptional regulator
MSPARIRSRSSRRCDARPRNEVDRAADLFSQRARQMQRDFVPLVSDYTNKLVRWIRFAAIVAVVLLIAYFVFQVVAQASLFEWIGDRIDNFVDDENGAGVTSGVRPTM